MYVFTDDRVCVCVRVCMKRAKSVERTGKEGDDEREEGFNCFSQARMIESSSRRRSKAPSAPMVSLSIQRRRLAALLSDPGLRSRNICGVTRLFSATEDECVCVCGVCQRMGGSVSE